MNVHASTKVRYFAKGTPHGWDTIKVKSESNPSKTYTVDVTHGRCSCPAWIFSHNKGNGLKPICKHLRKLHFRETANDFALVEPKKTVGPKTKVAA